ncbi:MAG: hypothetical protein JWR60_4011 [Polaromonas sp.]|nr:hypothetical protein [Polaromonas sp.]
MAYAAYREMVGASLVRVPAASDASVSRVLPGAARAAGAGAQWLVLDVTVPSCDAFVVRRALAGCPEAGIVRCTPRPDARQVRLEVRLLSSCTGEVMHRIMDSVPGGELGTLSSWKAYLQRHGLQHAG